jgi:2-amino-4-hydroxy-6-hydroxymethyldihydropteridine diphosphokinase
MGTLRVDAPKLTLPHPRIRERLFVLMPLAEIAPDLMIDGAGVSALAEALATASHPKACVMDTGITARIKAAISGA